MSPIKGEVPIEKAYEFVDRAFDIGFDEMGHFGPGRHRRSKPSVRVL